MTLRTQGRHAMPPVPDDGEWDDFAMGDFESGEDDSI